jgi:hypothetical protein
MQEGRQSRRNSKRWIIDRTFTWPRSLKRLVNRYEF